MSYNIVRLNKIAANGGNMRLVLFSVLFLAAAGPALALDTTKLSYTLSAGYSKPMGGLWARDYKSSPFLGAGAEYDTGTEYHWGLELGYDTGHENKFVTKCDPGLLYIAPYVKELRFFDNWEYYGVIGAGLYHRWSNKYTDSGVTYKGGLSGKFGVNGGFGFAYNIAPGTKAGFDLRLHSVGKFIGIGPGKVTASNFVPSLTLRKKF